MKNKILAFITETAYPHRCPVCDRSMPFSLSRNSLPDQSCAESPLAHPACYKKLRFCGGSVCMRCGRPLPFSDDEYCRECVPRSFHFTRNIALMVYNDAAQYSLIRFKYHGRREFAVFYVRELIKRHRRELEMLRADAIIPVPIHRSRLMERGYNQAELLAFGLSEALGIPVRSDLLHRTRKTKRQKELGPKERTENVRGALSVPRRSFDGIRTVLLVDDIFTTGSTLEACSSVLCLAGIRRIVCISVAVAEGRNDG